MLAGHWRLAQSLLPCYWPLMRSIPPCWPGLNCNSSTYARRRERRRISDAWRALGGDEDERRPRKPRTHPRESLVAGGRGAEPCAAARRSGDPASLRAPLCGSAVGIGFPIPALTALFGIRWSSRNLRDAAAFGCSPARTSPSRIAEYSRKPTRDLEDGQDALDSVNAFKRRTRKGSASAGSKGCSGGRVQRKSP